MSSSLPKTGRLGSGQPLPSLDVLVRLLPVFRVQLADAERRLEQAQGDAEHLRQVVSGLEGLAAARRATMRAPNQADVADQAVEEAPRGQEAVRRLMAEDPEREWSLAAIATGVMQRGWIDPEAKVPRAAIRAATQRLASAGFAEKLGPGRYRLTTRGRGDGGPTSDG